VQHPSPFNSFDKLAFLCEGNEVLPVLQWAAQSSAARKSVNQLVPWFTFVAWAKEMITCEIKSGFAKSQHTASQMTRMDGSGRLPKSHCLISYSEGVVHKLTPWFGSEDFICHTPFEKKKLPP